METEEKTQGEKMTPPARAEAPDWTAITTAIVAVLAFIASIASGVFSFLTYTRTLKLERKKRRLTFQTAELKMIYDTLLIPLNVAPEKRKPEMYPEFMQLIMGTLDDLTDAELDEIKGILLEFASREPHSITYDDLHRLQVHLLSTFLELRCFFDYPDFSFVDSDTPAAQLLKAISEKKD